MEKENTDTSNNSSIQKETEAEVQKTKLDIFFSRIKRRTLKHLWVVRGSLILSAVLALYLLFMLGRFLIAGTEVQRYFQYATDFILAPQEKLEMTNERTNVLILGKGGTNHEAPDLTDTVIFVSFDHKENRIDLLSLPRDIWIPSLRAKLNSAYYWGEQKKEGGGGVLAKAIVEEIVGEPLHYYVVIDFDGFVETIDVVGGIQVDVERGFTDDFYPIPGKENDECGGDLEYKCRYETIEFKKGTQTMDGGTALKYVRSRNAKGDEGTDLARSARQQKVLSAIKDKILSKEVILSPKKLLRIKDVLVKNSETDFTDSAAAVLARRLFESRDSVITHSVPEEFFLNPPYTPRYDNLYVFIPADEDWSSLHGWIECNLAIESCD